MATISVNLVARTRAFERGLRRSQKRLRAFANNVRSTVRSIARIGMVGSVAAVGLGYLVKKQMDFIDSTGKLARRIGMSTENLIGLQHAAELSGVSTEGLNKAMEVFVQRLGETRMGVGQARYSLDALGLSADKLSHMMPAEAFRVTADRINDLTTQADKYAAAAFLMGRQGRQMLNMIKQGSRGLLAAQRDAERLGLTFTMQQALKVEAANDALYRMGRVLKGLGQTLAIKLAPGVERVADRFTEWATSGPGAAAKIETAIKDMTDSIIDFGDNLDQINLKWKAFRLGALEGKADIYDFIEGLAPVSPLVTMIKWGLSPESQPSYIAHQAREQAKILQEEIDKGLKTYLDKVRDRADRPLPHVAHVKAYAEHMDKLARAADKTRKATEKLHENLRKEADRLKLTLRSSLQVLSDYVLHLKKMYDIGALTLLQGAKLAKIKAEELTPEVKTPKPAQWQFIRGQSMQFDPRHMVGGIERSGVWLQIQSAEVSELKQQTTELKDIKNFLREVGNKLSMGWFG